MMTGDSNPKYSGISMKSFQSGALTSSLFMFLGLIASPAGAATISYPGFASAAGLSVNGTAAVVTTTDGRVMRLASASTFTGGSVFSTTALNAADFSAFFSFRFTNPGGISAEGADGLAFVIQPVSSGLGGLGGGLGYEGISPSVAVEFDTFQNGWDPDNSHVAITQNGDVTSHLALFSTGSPKLQNGNQKFAWVDYNGTALEVRLSESSTRPASPVLTRVLNVPSILGTTNAFIGFTGATGSAFLNHDLIGFEYVTTFAPIGGVPEPSSVALLSSALVALAMLRRSRNSRSNF
jgi:hypothetical protein